MWVIIGVLILAAAVVGSLVWAACVVVNKRKDREEGVYDVERAERARPQPPSLPPLPDPAKVSMSTDSNHNTNSIKTILEQAEADLTVCKTILEQAEATLTTSGDIVHCPSAETVIVTTRNRQNEPRRRTKPEPPKPPKRTSSRGQNVDLKADSLSAEADLATCATILEQAEATLTANREASTNNINSNTNSVPSAREVSEIINRHHSRILCGRDILNMDEEEKDRLSGAVRDALMRDLDSMGRGTGDPARWWEGVAEVLEAVDFSSQSAAPPTSASYKIPTSSFDFSWIRRSPHVLKNDLSPIIE